MARRFLQIIGGFALPYSTISVPDYNISSGSFVYNTTSTIFNDNNMAQWLYTNYPVMEDMQAVDYHVFSDGSKIVLKNDGTGHSRVTDWAYTQYFINIYIKDKNGNDVIFRDTKSFCTIYIRNKSNDTYQNNSLAFIVDDDLQEAWTCQVWMGNGRSGYESNAWGNSSHQQRNQLYNWLLDVPEPIVIDYKSILYFKTPDYHRLLWGIVDDQTNHGDEVTNAPRSYFKYTPLESCIEEITKNLPIGSQMTIAWTSDKNRVDFERTADTVVDDVVFRNFDVKYYINGERQDVLTHSITTYDNWQTAPARNYLSYLLDSENELCRPSFIHELRTVEPYTYNYNQESVGDAQQALWYTWLGTGYSLGFPGPHEFDPEPGQPAQPGHPGSGDGANDRTTGNTGFPELPGSQLTETGFFTLWNPTREQLINLADYMWSTFDPSNWKKLFADPMDCIIGLHMLPVDTRLLRGESPYDEKNINVGNISTGKPAYICRNQFIEITFGKLTIPAQTDSYMDYSPYMKAELHLPYIGVVSINPDDISRREVELRYHIDVSTGTCVAYLRCETDTGTEILYEWTGNCAAQIPFTGAGYKSIIESSIRIAVGVIGAVTGGPAGTALASSEIGSVVTSTATNVGQMKPEIARSGSLGNTSGYMAVQDAYFILSYPRQWRAEDQEAIEGYPLYTREKLSNMEGYTIIHDMHLEGMSCTSSEAEEIMSLLKGGVIL